MDSNEEDRKVAQAFENYNESRYEEHLDEEEREENEKLEACTLFHGLVQDRYEAISELNIVEAVRSMCARRTEPEEFIAVASQHYDVVPLANDTATDTPLYGILTNLPAGQMVLFNAFFGLAKEPDASGAHSFVYRTMDEVRQLNLTKVDTYLEMGFKINKGLPYPPAVWFAPVL